MNTDPPRLHDDPSFPDELRELVGHGQTPPPLDAAARAASLAQLGTVGATATVGGAATATGVKLWLVIGGLGVATIAAVVVKTSISNDDAIADVRTPHMVVEPEPVPDEVLSDEIVEPVAPEIIEAPAIQPEPQRTRTSDTVRASEATADTLALEAGILEQARVLLASDPQATLDTTRRHAREHPRGQLRAERELIAIDALRRLGRTSAARRRATSFLRSAPTGIYADRAQRILEQLDAPEAE